MTGLAAVRQKYLTLTNELSTYNTAVAQCNCSTAVNFWIANTTPTLVSPADFGHYMSTCLTGICAASVISLWVCHCWEEKQAEEKSAQS